MDKGPRSISVVFSHGPRAGRFSGSQRSECFELISKPILTAELDHSIVYRTLSSFRPGFDIEPSLPYRLFPPQPQKRQSAHTHSDGPPYAGSPAPIQSNKYRFLPSFANTHSEEAVALTFIGPHKWQEKRRIHEHISADCMPQDNKLAQRPLTIEKLSTPFIICGCIQIPEGCKRDIYRVAANTQGSRTAFAIDHELVQTLTSSVYRSNTFFLGRDHGRQILTPRFCFIAFDAGEALYDQLAIMS
ncbi:hypothetical protein V8E53_012760 [Lactarius tabidus]